jgi:hypothetical protein
MLVKYVVCIFVLSNSTFIFNIVTDCTSHRTTVKMGSEDTIISILFQEQEADSRHITVSWQLSFLPNQIITWYKHKAVFSVFVNVLTKITNSLKSRAQRFQTGVYRYYGPCDRVSYLPSNTWRFAVIRFVNATRSIYTASARRHVGYAAPVQTVHVTSQTAHRSYSQQRTTASRRHCH